MIRPDDAFLLAQWPERRDRQAKDSKHKELRGIPGDAYLQWFLVTAPGHPFLKAVLERVIAGLRSYRVFEAGVGQPAVLRLTGPSPSAWPSTRSAPCIRTATCAAMMNCSSSIRSMAITRRTARRLAGITRRRGVRSSAGTR